MNKSYVKRTKFFAYSTLTDLTLSVEADEAYIQQIQPSATTMKIVRERERQLVSDTANPGFTITGGVWNYGILDPSYGRVNLDVPLGVNGEFRNRLVTVTANDKTDPERNTNHIIGFKEKITFGPAADNTVVSFLLELVYYVPADEISI